jgi:hypothetical protein
MRRQYGLLCLLAVMGGLLEALYSHDHAALGEWSLLVLLWMLVSWLLP